MAATLRNPRYRLSSQASNAFAGRLRNPRFKRDMQNGGAYKLYGTVMKFSVAGSYRVRLLDQRNGYVIQETWSDNSGYYEFKNIAYRNQEYIIQLSDHTAPVENHKIAAFVTPVAM